MNCELAHERIVLAAYGELSDEQMHELDRHLVGCTECRDEKEHLLALCTLAAAVPAVEPDANLIARSRLRLEEALDALPPRRWYERWGQRVLNNLASVQAAPLAAALLLVAGAGAGVLGEYEYAQSRIADTATTVAVSANLEQAKPVQEATAQAVIPSEVASISSIVRQPNSNVVEVSYNQMIPHQVKGTLSDPAIRQLLMLASENATSPGVRDDSVGLLAA